MVECMDPVVPVGQGLPVVWGLVAIGVCMAGSRAMLPVLGIAGKNRDCGGVRRQVACMVGE